MSSFRVELKKVVDDSYDIEVGCGLEERLAEDIKNGLVGSIRKFAVVTDSNVRPLHAEKICSLLTDMGHKADIIEIPAGEEYKSRETKEFVEDRMLELGCRRDCCVIAVGGGVVTDLAGFTAGTFGRGVPFINYATTLLAAADASVGGKTAVDTPLATNLIGLFNQPEKVYIDISAWKTLPERQVASGLAETVKHACMADREFFDYLNENIGKVFENDGEVCRHIAETNCRIKYNVVMKDELESGMREILNLGHTVGRAIETVSGYRLLHGEAVSIGLMAEVKMAVKLGYCEKSHEDMMRELLLKAKLPVDIPDYIDREALVKKLYTDKKVRNGELRFVLQKGIGDIMVFDNEQYAKPVPESLAREIIMDM
ncbi:MAG: 3-dehydroquinate synthase [Huintestinicola sp.]